MVTIIGWVDTPEVVCSRVDGTKTVGLGVDATGDVPAVVTDGVDGREGVVERHLWNRSTSQFLLQTA